MDPPYIHQPRYVLYSPQPIPENPNFYGPRHRHPNHPHHLVPLAAQPPPQPIPPPPRPPYHPFAAPSQPPPQQRPFNLNQSQLTFNPGFNPNPNHSIEGNHHPRSHHPQLHDLAHSPRVSHRILFDNDHPLHHRLSEIDHSYRENRPESWDPSRVVAENRPARSHPVVKLDHELHHRQFDHRPMSPYRPNDKFRHDIEDSSRFTEEYSNEFGHNQREEIVWSRSDGRRDENYHRRGNFVSDSDRSSRNFASNHSPSSRVIQLNPGSYEDQYGTGLDHELIRSNGRDGASETHRWGRDRQALRDIHDSLIVMGNNEIGDGDGAQIFSRKHDFYSSKVERYNDRGSREGTHEVNRTPRKQLQKKSALLRIQMAKPNHRNREDERSHYSGYFNETKPNSFRGKDQLGYSDHGKGEEDREGSPVELDVSFKSNSLVAKAIMAPSSSVVVSDTNLTPRSTKIRKMIESDKDCSISQLTNLSVGTVEVDSSTHVANNVSSSDKDCKKCDEKVAASNISNMCDGRRQPCSNKTSVLLEKSKVERFVKGTLSGKGGTDVSSGKTSSQKVVKRKKVVRKVVKKVVNPHLRLSSSQPTKKFDETVEVDCSACSPPAASKAGTGVTPSKRKIPSAVKASVHVVDSQTCPNDKAVLPESDKVDGSTQVLMSEEVGSDVDFGISCVSKNKRKRSCSNSPLGSSCHEETKIEEGFVNEDNSFHGLFTISNTDKSFTKSLSETAIPGIGNVEDLSKQFCQSKESLLSVGNNVNLGLLGSEKNNIHEGLVNTCNSVYGMNTSTDFDNGLINSKERTTISDAGTVDAVCHQPCTNQVSQSVESNIVEGFPKANFPVGSSEIVAMPRSEETRIGNGSDKILASDKACINSNETNDGTGDNICEQLSPVGVIVSFDNVPTEGSPNTVVPIRGSEEDLPNIKDKGKVGTSQLDLSSSTITGMYIGSANVLGFAHCLDKTLSLSVNDPSPAEVTDTSIGCFDEVTVLNGNSSTVGFSEANVSTSSGVNVESNGTSLEDEEVRKVSASHPVFSSLKASVVNEGPVIADISTSGVEFPSNSNGVEMYTAALPPCVLLENTSAQGIFEAVSSVKDASRDDELKIDHPRVGSCTIFGESALPSSVSLCPAELGSEQVANKTPVKAGNNYQDDVMDIESGREEKMDVDAVEERVTIRSETNQCRIPSEHQSPEIVKDDLPSVSNYPALFADGNGISTANANDEIVEFLPDTLSDVGSPTHNLNCKATLSQISNVKIFGNDKASHEMPVIDSACTSHSWDTKVNLKTDDAMGSDHLATRKTGPLPSQYSKNITHTPIPINGEIHGRKNQLNHVVPRPYPGHSSYTFTTSKNTASSTRITKPRTWHRTGNTSASLLENKPFPSTVPSQRQLSKKGSKFQSTSYIRKGNSLVRKPDPVAARPQGFHGLNSSVYQLNSSGIDEVKKSTGSDSRADFIDPPDFLRAGGPSALFERSKTPPLPSISKVPNRSRNSSVDCTSSPLAEPHLNCCSETTSDPMKVTETNHVPNSAEDALKIFQTPVDQKGSIDNLECQSELNDGILASSNVKKITYVKRKSNQLVATSNHCGLSVHDNNKAHAYFSDGYYKRSKNQLIRTSLESHIKQTFTIPDNASNSEGQMASQVISSRSFSKRRAPKVVTKIRKPSKFSLVWTQHGSQLSKNDGDSLRHQKVLPHLFPWKRATHWRSFMQNSASISNNSPLSMISRKLLVLRKRDAVYTRSTHGFSLRKSKVLSVGGSSLKWSKSIERKSKKANEEATLAVAAVERKKREQKGAACVVSQTKNRNNSSRERIFRIGSVRYKMDSSRRTLQRIPDGKSSCSADLQSENDAKKSYVPRRLVIGNDEYVQIGNGNQLIRDPKKRSRVLASEKVRWSLHTVRLRLARKRKYCQFYTRFGKCNKDDGKCPYIHDPSKIAVCTKFLNGLCSNPNCKLTHKVIPERMPDCSYFLQGLCTNKNCPYRHVHVNPNASTCEGFLRGYCADGNECRKKHSYVCPIFESTGSCPQGLKCKLHHPKKRGKGKKSKRSKEQKNNRGRYFGSMHIGISEPRTSVLGKHPVQDNDYIFAEGKIADFIRLGVSDEEAELTNDPSSEQTTFYDNDPSDFQLDDLDKLIRPILIMNLMT